MIEDPVIWYSNREIVTAVLGALAKKAAKGASYSSDKLVLHTLSKPGVPEALAIGMTPVELSGLARALVTGIPELTERFKEIWLLSRDFEKGRRLYRLA